MGEKGPLIEKIASVQDWEEQRRSQDGARGILQGAAGGFKQSFKDGDVLDCLGKRRIQYKALLIERCS